MGRYVFKLPDVGEGTAEAELVGWHVKVGDMVAEDQIIADIMTDKATVELTSPVAGRVTAAHGDPGQQLAVGSPLVEFEVEGAGNASAAADPSTASRALPPAGGDCGADCPPDRGTEACAAGFEGGGASPAFPAPSTSNSTSGEPTASCWPGSPWAAVTRPATGLVSSTVALSVMTSAMIWSSATMSPTLTCQPTSSASAVPSPTSGSLKT